MFGKTRMVFSKRRLICVASAGLLAGLHCVSSGITARANDWGYEGEPPVKPPLEEQSAAGLAKSLKPAGKSATVKNRSLPATKPSAGSTAKPSAGGGAKTGAKSPSKTSAGASASTGAGPADGMGAGSTESTGADSAESMGPKTNMNGGSAASLGSFPIISTPKKTDSSVYTKKSKTGGTNAGTGAPAATPSPFARVRPSGSNAGTSDSGIDSILDKDQQAVRCWLQLFQVVSKQRMEYGDQKKLEAYMLGKSRQGEQQAAEVRSILKFWPKLMNDIRDKPQLELEYSDLFKALLRIHERSATENTNVEGSEFASDSDFVTQLLGLQRVAVSGNPAFTEDAVNAYADMAIFIYEQQHAGRTIDANDNRALFAKVVVNKFNEAPTDKDRRAMTSFDLAWAKFKIIWQNSDQATHQILMEKLVKTGAGSTLTVTKDPLLDLVLSNWPWKTTP